MLSAWEKPPDARLLPFHDIIAGLGRHLLSVLDLLSNVVSSVLCLLRRPDATIVGRGFWLSSTRTTEGGGLQSLVDMVQAGEGQ